MKYLLMLVLGATLSFGASASLPDDFDSTPSQSINSASSDRILMKDDTPSIPVSYKLGHCMGRFLDCWNKGEPEGAESKGSKFHEYSGTASLGAGAGTGWGAFMCFCCGYCKCCMNGDACCVRYVDSCCCFCGNGGCLMTAKWAGIAAGGCVGLAVCCCLMKNCCENSPNCEELLVKMHCMNCAKGMQDGRSKKMDDEAPQQSAAAPHQSYQNV